jgi:hypothetical protein
VRLLDEAGDEATIFRTGDRLGVEIAYDAHEPVAAPEFGLAFYRHDGLHITGPNTRAGGLEMGMVEGPGVVRYTIERLPFLPGRYQISAAIHDSGHPLAYDYHEEAYAFRVVEGGTAEGEGFLALDAAWEWYSLPVDETAKMAYPAAGPI